ncbi:MAG: hypothetical protein IKF19_01815 [Bacilli bacterium]|nr:hypothetical protein [Bacilli bacterium]
MIDVDDYKLQMTNSTIHNLNEANRILILFFMMMFIIFADSSMDMFMINLFLLVILVWCNISFKILFKSINLFSSFLFLFCFFVSLIFLNIYIGLFWMIKIIDVIVIISILGMTASYVELVKGVRFWLKPFSFICDVNKLSLNIGGYLKSLTIIYNQRERIHVSKRLRGVKFESMGFVDKIDLLLHEFGGILKFSAKRIDSFKDNIYVNKYGIGSIKGNYRLNKWTKTDTILLIVSVLMLFAILFY